MLYAIAVGRINIVIIVIIIFVVAVVRVQFSCSVVSYYVDTPSLRSHSVNSGRHFTPRVFVR